MTFRNSFTGSKNRRSFRVLRSATSKNSRVQGYVTLMSGSLLFTFRKGRISENLPPATTTISLRSSLRRHWRRQSAVLLYSLLACAVGVLPAAGIHRALAWGYSGTAAKNRELGAIKHAIVNLGAGSRTFIHEAFYSTRCRLVRDPSKTKRHGARHPCGK